MKDVILPRNSVKPKALHLVSLIALAVGLMPNVGSAQNPPPVGLNIPNLLQETQVWCWAAVAQQIIAATQGRHNTPPQCALVAIANGAPPQACCGVANPACIRTGSLQQIQFLIAQFGGTYSTLAPPTDPMTLYQTLAAGRPIILHVASGLMSSHVVVLRGMEFVHGPMGVVPVLHINDPLSYFTQPVPFQNLMGVWIAAIVVG
jgi:hypothetical protein